MFIRNTFLVEGLKDYQFIYCILHKRYSKYSYEVIDCSGKTICLKINDVLKTKFSIDTFVLYDRDNEDISEFAYYFCFENNIEKDLNLNQDKSDCSEISLSTIDNILKKYKRKNELFNNINSFLTRNELDNE